MLNIAIVGNVNAGKTSLTSVLSTGELDDGNGLARAKIMAHKHEIETGRTSSITTTQMQKAGSDDIICLVDLAGHEKYLKTTISGLTTYAPKLALVAISAEDGISRMTMQHVHVCRTLKIPIMIVITKVDHFQSAKQHNDLIASIKGMLNKFGIKFSYDLNLEMFTDKKPLDEEKQGIVFNHFTASDTHTPIFKVSAKTGQNIPMLVNFLFRLPPLTRVGSSIGPVSIHSESLEKFIGEQKIDYIFFVYRPFFVKGIGWIVHGCNKGLPIKKGAVLKLGPIGSIYREVRVRSIHSEVKEELDVLPTGISGCLALKPIGAKNDTFSRNDFTRGKVLTDRPFFVKQIRALIEISNQHGTVSVYPGYTSLIVCGNLSAPGIVVKVEKITKTSHKTVTEGDKLYLSNGERGIVVIQFNKPQFIYPSARLVVSDGKVKIIGIIQEISTQGFLKYSPSIKRSFRKQLMDSYNVQIPPEIDTTTPNIVVKEVVKDSAKDSAKDTSIYSVLTTKNLADSFEVNQSREDT